MTSPAYLRYCMLSDKLDTEGGLSFCEAKELEHLKASDPRCLREEEVMGQLRSLAVESSANKQALVEAVLEAIEQEDRVVPLRPEFAPRRESQPFRSQERKSLRAGARRLAALLLAAAAPAAALYLVTSASPWGESETMAPPGKAQHARSPGDEPPWEIEVNAQPPLLEPSKDSKPIPPSAAESNLVTRENKAKSIPRPPVVEKLTKKELLSQARAAIGRGDWSGAARAYRQLRKLYPGSAESRTVLVALGQLELDRLGQPSRALRSFNRYLRGGGSLSHEARHGKIRALHALGNRDGEKAALTDFLQHHQGSADVPSLRRRLSELEQ